HAIAAQRDRCSNRLPLAHLERGNRFLRAARYRFLSRDPRELVRTRVDDLDVRCRLAQTHVDDHLLDLRDRHHVRVAELLAERRNDFFLILVSHAVHLSTTPSHLRQMRTLRPSPRILWPIRVWAPHSGHTSCTLLACTDASRSTMPPLMFLPGFGLVWRLIMFTPSTTSRFLSGCTRRTRPRLPRSLPVITSTLSFFRMGVARLDISNSSEHFRSQRNDLHEPALAQLARHRTEDARADRLALVVDQHGGVAVEAN